MRPSTEAAIDRSIKRLGGDPDAAAVPPPRRDDTERQDGAAEMLPPTSPPTVTPIAEQVDTGWIAWLGDPEGDMEHRKWGIVVDAAADEKIVVLRSRKRQGRMEAWLEAWPLAGLDPVNTMDPGSSKRIQAAKAACEAIAAGKSTGRWDDRDEELLAAIGVLTAPFSAGKRSA